MSDIGKEEVWKSILGMKNGKAVGPDNISVEAWKCLRQTVIEFLTALFNKIVHNEPMPLDWAKHA